MNEWNLPSYDRPEIRCVPQGNGTWRCEYLNYLREDIGLALIAGLIALVLVLILLHVRSSR